MRPLEEKYASYIESATRENTGTASIVIFEVYRRLKAKKDEQIALEAYAQMTETKIVDLDDQLAPAVADISLETARDGRLFYLSGGNKTWR